MSVKYVKQDAHSFEKAFEYSDENKITGHIPKKYGKAKSIVEFIAEKLKLPHLTLAHTDDGKRKIAIRCECSFCHGIYVARLEKQKSIKKKIYHMINSGSPVIWEVEQIRGCICE